MNWAEEQRFQEADKIVRKICTETGWSYLDGAKFLLDWCKEVENKELEHKIEGKETNIE